MFWKTLARLLATPRALSVLRYLARRPHAVDLGSYMGRWWLFNPYDRPGHIRWLPSVRLHHIRRPDKGRDLHNHPWTFRTFILKGWYREQIKLGAGQSAGHWRDRRAGQTGVVRHGTFHRIASVSDGGCWTLVVTYRKRSGWGFLGKGGVFIPHEYYEGEA